MKPQTERALGRFLSIRERSREEISRYLKKKQVDESEIAGLVERWAEVGILDDKRFTGEVVRSYLNKGKGQLFIRHKLREAGVGRDQTETAIRQIPKQDLKLAMERRLKRAERRLSALPGPLRRQKAISILSTSGFLMEGIMSFIDGWAKKE